MTHNRQYRDDTKQRSRRGKMNYIKPETQRTVEAKGTIVKTGHGYGVYVQGVDEKGNKVIEITVPIEALFSGYEDEYVKITIEKASPPLCDT